MSTLQEELRVLMLPWVGVLRDYVDVGEWSTEWDARGERIVWVKIVGDSARDDAQRAFDALELLTLVGEIDFFAWRMALAASWPRQATLWVEAANGHALHMGWKLVFHSVETTKELANWCARIVVDGAAQTGSTEYLRARTVLENLYERLDKQKTMASREQLQIPVQLVMRSGDPETGLLQVLHVVGLQHAREASTGRLFHNDRWKPLMKITDVDIGIHYRQTPTKAFLYTAQLAAFGVQLNLLSLAGVRAAIDTAMLYIAGLQCLLATKGVDQKGASGVRSVVIPAVIPRDVIPVIFSALLDSSSVRNVALNKSIHSNDAAVSTMDTEDRELLWKWIAIALFSSHATNQVAHVDIDVDSLCERDVDTMRRALQQPYPFEDAPFERDQHCSGPIQVADVVASKFRLLQPQQEVPRGVEPTVVLERQKVRVLSKGSDGWVTVRIPGWGVAWVHEQDHDGCARYTVQPSTVRSIPNVSLSNLSESCATPAISLLRLVGHDVRTLCFDAGRPSQRIGDWLRAFLQACPRLEELKLTYGGADMDLDAILEGYERGCCRLHHLNWFQTYNNSEETVIRFIRALVDPKHPISRYLRGLTLSYDMRTPSPMLPEAIHAMLNANKTLETLCIRVGYRISVPRTQLPQRREFRVYETPIATRMFPLSLSKKLAFLSVTSRRLHDHHAQIQASPSVLHQIDSRIIALIFEFAAQCRKRRVDVKFSCTTA